MYNQICLIIVHNSKEMFDVFIKFNNEGNICEKLNIKRFMGEETYSKENDS